MTKIAELIAVVTGIHRKETHFIFEFGKYSQADLVHIIVNTPLQIEVLANISRGHILVLMEVLSLSKGHCHVSFG